MRASDSMAHLAGKISGMSDLGLRTANCRRFWETQVGTRSLDSLRPSELITTAESWETFEFYGFWEAFRGFWVTRGIYAIMSQILAHILNLLQIKKGKILSQKYLKYKNFF